MTVAGFYASSRHSTGFGVVDAAHPTPHLGDDWAWGSGTPIPSYVSGTVEMSGRDTGYGNWVTVRTGSRFFWYCHMSTPTPLKRGQAVAVGTIVGYVGSTGSFATGAHLHTGASTSDPYPANREDLFDPHPTIVAAHTSAAGGNANPIEENDLDATQDARLTNVEGLVSQIRNLLTDPNQATQQALSAARAANATATTVANLINDPTSGVLVAISKLKVTGGTVDPAAVAKILAPLVADELAKRLSNG